MTDRSYSQRQALHYAAYRPPLHALLLSASLGNERFSNGLDIGCGMGHSTVALKEWCDRVTGIDPGEAMIRRAIHAEGITYSVFDGALLPFPDRHFDLITLAGSWFYARSVKMYRELLRTTENNATILLYDFSLDLTEVARLLHLHLPHTTYEHDANLDPFAGENELEKKTQRILTGTLKIAADNMTHLVMAEDGWRDTMKKSSFPGIREAIYSAGLEEYSYKAWISHYQKPGG